MLKGIKRINPRLLKSEPLRRCRLEECRAACCLHGAWLDTAEAADILAHTALILPHLPQNEDHYLPPKAWFEPGEETDAHALSGRVIHTQVLIAPDHYGGTACFFLRPDYKCALQVAAELAGMHPWRFKPFYCILHPLDIDPEGRITLDETPALLAEAASCLRPCEESVPLLKTFEPELRYLLGDKGYENICAMASTHALKP